MSRAKNVSRAEWARRIERWKDSGLTAAEFAGEMGFNPRTLTYWKCDLGKQARSGASLSEAPRVAQAEPSAFIELKPTTPEVVEVVIGDVALKIPATIEVAVLTRLIRAVRAAC